jgi:Rieske Fe-S protein
MLITPFTSTIHRTITSGYQAVICSCLAKVYRRTLGEVDDFIALDLTCTNEPLGTCKLALDDTGFYLVCPCCGSKFFVWDGQVTAGPAIWPLKEYATSLTLSTVRIYN